MSTALFKVVNGKRTGEVKNYCSFVCRNENWKQLEGEWEWDNCSELKDNEQCCNCYEHI